MGGHPLPLGIDKQDRLGSLDLILAPLIALSSNGVSIACPLSQGLPHVVISRWLSEAIVVGRRANPHLIGLGKGDRQFAQNSPDCEPPGY
jgi:hypothetical protein